jgi:hypothetical protein
MGRAHGSWTRPSSAATASLGLAVASCGRDRERFGVKFGAARKTSSIVFIGGLVDALVKAAGPCECPLEF